MQIDNLEAIAIRFEAIASVWEAIAGANPTPPGRARAREKVLVDSLLVITILILIVTTSKALVTSSVALVTSNLFTYRR